LKKQDKHPIDQFFKENTDHNFPYDPNLWKKAEADLNVHAAKKRTLVYSTVLLAFISGVIALIWFSYNENSDRKYTKDSESANIKTDNLIIADQQSNDIRSDEAISKSQNSRKNDIKAPESEISSQPNKKAGKSKFLSKSNTNNTITPADLAQNSGSKDKPFSPLPAKTEPSLILDTNSKNVGSFDNIELLSKLGIKLPIHFSNNDPELNRHNFTPEPKRFSKYIEFENYTSLVLNQTLSGLNQKELEMKQNSESPENLTGFGLNYIVQKGGLGFVIGLGHLQGSVNTNYSNDTGQLKLVSTVTKYKMIRDSVPYSGGYYSNIIEYDEGVYERIDPFQARPSSYTFQWIQLPIQLSYQYSKNRWRISCRTGVELMYLYRTKGSIINKELDGTTQLGSGEQKINRWNMSGSVQLLTGYQLNHKWHAGAKMFYNQQLGSNFSAYKSRFQSVGIGWYLRMSL